jgi:hypothetical protein
MRILSVQKQLLESPPAARGADSLALGTNDSWDRKHDRCAENFVGERSRTAIQKVIKLYRQLSNAALLVKVGSVRRLLVDNLLAVGNLKHSRVVGAHDHVLMLLIRDPDGCARTGIRVRGKYLFVFRI